MRSMYDIRLHNENPLEYWKGQLRIAQQINNKEMIDLSNRMIERHQPEERKDK